MKKIKTLLILALACLTVLGVGTFTACNDNGSSSSTDSSQDSSDSSEIENPNEYIYKIRTQSEGGFGLKDINVALYNGETKITSVNTNAEGNAFFTEEHISTLGTYRIELTNVPKGWSVKDDSVIYQTSTVFGSNVTINFGASLITDEETPAGKMYRVGDVMYDFTMEDCAGDTYTLSELLQQKKMVMLNFWATYCGPCASEFPVMDQAYKLYQSSVEILAVSNYEPDNQSAVASYKASKNLTFPMSGVPESAVLTSHFNTSAVPVSVVIDRYGVVSYMHTGNMLALTDFTSLFDKFVNDDYVQTVISSESSEEGSNGVLEFAKPDVSNPNISDVQTAFSGSANGFTYSWETDDEYAWPWQIGQDDNGSYLAASNKEIDYSYAVLNIDFTAEANTALAFDYTISTEPNADYLYVMLDGTVIHALSGLQEDLTTCYAYVFEQAHAGEHRLTLIYMKDASTSGTDDVFVKDLRFLNKSDLALDGLDLNILRHASTEWNNPADFESGASKTTRFAKYVNVKLGADGYYHVIPDNAPADYTVNLDTDPLLLADVMNSTPWNKYDLWQLAYNDVLVYEGYNLSGLVEEYAWAGTNSSNGFVPVTPTLKNLLMLITALDPVVGEEKDGNDNASRVNYFDKNCHVSYHDNEWLELCLYYSHYGNSEPIADPTRGITYDGAIEIFEGTNQIDCFASIVPIGIKHKFTPTTSGVYHFYSTFAPEFFDKSESYNPQMWLVDSDQKTFLAENADFVIHHTGNPENFDVKYYLEAGKTYYCLFAFFLNATGEFELQIDYLGTYYENLTNCAVGPYTMNMVTNDVYTPGAQNVLYDEENDVYRVANKDGVFLGDIYAGLDDRVYWDLTNVTLLFPSNSLASFINNYESYDVDKRLFYLNDENGNKKDYSAFMRTTLFQASLNNGQLNGKIAVTKELMHIMVELTKAHDGFGGITNSWQMMCYYYQPIGEQ